MTSSFIKFKRLIIIALILLSGFVFSQAKAAGNAIFELKADHTDNTYYVGQDILIDVLVKPNGESLNVSRIFLNFTVNGVGTVQSWDLGDLFPYMSPGRELSNTTGVINQGGYILLPDLVTTDGTFDQIKFKAEKVGQYTITFTDGSHLIDPSPTSPEPVEKINLSLCQPITIYVVEHVNLAPVFDAIPAKSVIVGQSVNFMVRATDPDGSNVSFLTNTLPAGSSFNITSNNNIEAEGNFSWTPTVPGIYHAIFNITDSGPGTPKTASQDVLITVLPPPNQAPIFDSVGIQNVNINNTVTFHVKAVDPEGEIVRFLTNSLPAGSTFNITKNNESIVEGDFTWVPTVLGTYHAIFNVADNNATDPKTASLDVTINVTTPANHPPVFIPIGTRNVQPGTNVSFVVSAADSDGDLVTLTWDIPAGAVFNNVVNNANEVSGNFSFTPTQEGVYYAIFHARDNSSLGPLNADMTVTINVNVPGNHPPTISSVPEQKVNAGDSVTFDIVATDPDGNNVTLTSQLPTGATFIAPAAAPNVTGRFAWTPTVSGEYYVLITGTDDHPTQPLSTTRSVRILVFGGACPVCTCPGGGTSCPTANILGIRITGTTIKNIETLGETDNRLKAEIEFVGIAENITKKIRLHDNTTGQTYEFEVTDPANWQTIVTDNFSVGIHKIYAEAIDANGFAFAISPIYELNIKMPEKTIVEKIVPGEVINTINNITNTITETKIVKEIQEKFLDNKNIEEAAVSVAPTLAVISAAITIPAVATSAIGFLPFLSIIFTEPLALLFAQRRKKWGTIYDSLSKMPLDLAIVRLYNVNTRQIVQTKVTDKEGRFMMNVKDPGSYYLTVTKPNYKFPTEFLKDENQDNKLLDLYHGELIQVKEATMITPNIPVDPVDKPQLSHTQLAWDHFKGNFKKSVSYIGLILAIISFIIMPSWLMGGLVIVHVVMFTLLKRLGHGKKPKNWGIIYDQTSKKPLKNAVVRIFDNKFNKLLDTQMTDSKGRYAFLVGENKYTITSELDGYDKNSITPLDLKQKKDKIVNLDLGLNKKV